ncbi:hypothetical protein [Nocardioides mesophilus]|uniref:Uncharacterized protein n=1 Tax=Nocardioides mesophilus TaxID=433659 RepID=A0A7G9RA69_9ACTN|nr:hypothetical protein [Nocardioides mesophilus]QNN52494.1 hypothetical protein H9L09_18800 [Nocardioides mesophilus]
MKRHPEVPASATTVEQPAHSTVGLVGPGPSGSAGAPQFPHPSGPTSSGRLQK